MEPLPGCWEFGRRQIPWISCLQFQLQREVCSVLKLWCCALRKKSKDKGQDVKGRSCLSCPGEVTVEEMANAETQWIRSALKIWRPRHITVNWRVSRACMKIAVESWGARKELTILIYHMRRSVQPYYREITTFRLCLWDKTMRECKLEATLAQLRKRVWTVKSRQFVKRTLANYTVCRRYEGCGYRVPPPSNLPEFRLSQKPAFTYVELVPVVEEW